MPYLRISNSDGDVYLDVTEDWPDDEDLEFQHIHGLEYLRSKHDSNYWPEGVVVVVEVKEANPSIEELERDNGWLPGTVQKMREELAEQDHENNL